MSFLVELLVSGVVLGLIYALVALGFVLIYKASRVVNFAQGELIAIGAFSAHFFLSVLKLPVVLAFLLALAFTALVGYLLERVFLKRLVGQPIISVIMATIGLAFFLDGLLHLTPYGAGSYGYPRFLPEGGIVFLGARIAYPQLLALGLTVAFLFLFTWFFQRSTLGVAMRSVADDQMAAMSLGVSVAKVFALAWAAAGLSAAAGGVMVGTIAGLNLDGLVHIGLRVFPVVILGGLDSIPGAVVAGILIGVLENLAAGFLDPYIPGGGTRDVFPFLVLLLVLWFKPHGLFGTEEIERV
ncbi:MAG: branched-chain amino acid ABC transporter permease [Thermus sp.]|uniref:branched-chain amino acid ABC transporter permease n=1 Tax=unclassified Thermus TaxID=2619321 RepID=UPI0002389420|nr:MULTISPECIES: branched-chain amino acid ABC transporter permease [unclassified Thermus]AEV16728.1 Branched-chain amino acid transport system permease protein livH [Thermus sp. CCB_US3_UF1]MCS6867376.1 branched-chain amino acid ABC transporter permease [Thermus sp.]MCS7219121.1 branched-chain amino acid ABC transporter permease [Thermus sp.]MCX7850653.1 branched-chain amino acid ABC transporter permease [Thermus sp.]MDW8016349.1 branched-chain amino acid ABC transporter permease [Thermus sp.